MTCLRVRMRTVFDVQWNAHFCCFSFERQTHMCRHEYLHNWNRYHDICHAYMYCVINSYNMHARYYTFIRYVLKETCVKWLRLLHNVPYKPGVRIRIDWTFYRELRHNSFLFRMNPKNKACGCSDVFLQYACMRWIWCIDAQISICHSWWFLIFVSKFQLK